jgi:molybdopterin molybdotransferase
MKGPPIGLKEALQLVQESIRPLSAEKVSLADSIDRILVDDLYALVDSPSVDASLMDGFAVSSRDCSEADPDNPVRLPVTGTMAAGGERNVSLKPGTAVKVLTGAAIPLGADAVVAHEDVNRSGDEILICRALTPGANILPRGTDVASKKRVISAGSQIFPGLAGLAAAAGHAMVSVRRSPVVGIVATGDEVVAPGRPLAEGKLYASNIVTLAGWCGRYRMKSLTTVVKDGYEAILSVLRRMSEETDVMLTSGGAWTGDRDIVAHVLKDLGWKEIFHHVRIGPGKAAGFGLLNGKPVFILPGGPPSNLMAFLQLALPGLLTLSGCAEQGLPHAQARLACGLSGRDRHWTDFFYGTLETDDGLPSSIFRPLEHRSRLSSIAQATAVAGIPEGMDCLDEGAPVSVQLLK